MKVLLINGSPDINGCIVRALHEVEKMLHENGIDTEMIHVGNKDIRGCIACHYCRQHNKCVFDDLVNATAPKFAEADGISSMHSSTDSSTAPSPLSTRP